MKKIAVALLFFGLFSLAVFAQSGRARPRVVVTDNTASSQKNAPAQTSDSTNQTTNSNQDTTKRPPVLIGDTKSSGQSTDSAATGGNGGDDEVIRVETNLVTIPVSVLDRDGRFIAGLRQQDFHIYEDGKEQKVEYFAPVEQPFTVILMLDVSNSTEFKIEDMQNAAIAFINQLRPDDRVMVMAFDDKIHILSPITNNRAVLANAVRQTDFGGGTSLYEAVDYAINKQLQKIEGRKAVVMFTDGVDTTSRRANYQSSVRDAEEADALFYPIRYDTFGDMGGNQGGGYPYPTGRGSGGVWGGILGGILNGGNIRIGNGGGMGQGGSGTSRAEYETGRRYLQDLANVSGGRMFEASSLYNIDTAFSGIAEKLRRQYSIGYYPETIGQVGQRKQIKVRTDRQDAVVRAKNSYIVGETDAKNTANNTKQKPKLTNSRLPF
ncbi:MAG: VWA domain-containing protein [Pyrinomonadaceae bacterium]